MKLSIEQQRAYVQRIMLARMRILANNGFYGLLLMHMKFALDESLETAATDGERIFFNPAFMDELSDSELEFILIHEILHIVLQHVFRTGKRDNETFNIACDIVVNSNILLSSGMDIKSITLSKYGESMHLTPEGLEGFDFTAEEVYEKLIQKQRNRASGKGGNRGDSDPGSSSSRGNSKPGKSSSASSGEDHDAGNKQNKSLDDHSKWGQKDEASAAEWAARIQEAYDANIKSHGLLSGRMKRGISELLHPKTDWKTLLNDFVQEEIVDYSFSPPDRRFGDSPFFLPDFNEKDESIKNILFMIDTSGSMSTRDITEAYSEVKGAIDQFNGRLEGWLGFFDAEVVPPIPFADEKDLEIIKAYGGGGTSFKTIFSYIADNMADMEISSIIILTDGYAPFPDQTDAMGIPVLWMINNNSVEPPWGKVARI